MTRSSVLLAVVCLLIVAAADSVSLAHDWPNWRGPNRDAICRETGLLKSWPPQGPKLLWKAVGLGQGYSGPAIVGNVLYTMGNLDGKERVLALDTNTGRRLWSVAIGPVQYDGYSPGMRGTPTVDGDRLYALGASGRLACIDRGSAAIRFSRSFLTDFGAKTLKWGYSESVLIDGQRLLCTPGGPRATLAALDKLTGRTIWTSDLPDRASYASMVKATMHGVEQYVQFTADGLVGVDAGDGRLLWRYDAPAYTQYGGINISTPICSGNAALAASGYDVGGGLARIEKTPQGFTAREVYFTKEMKNHHGGMILLDGVLYGCNNPGILTCLEYHTGKVLWRSRAAGKCSLLYADGMLYCRDENGPITIAPATTKGFRPSGRFQQPHRSDQKAWPHLVIAHGRMYVRDQDVLLCYDVRNAPSAQ